MEIREQIRADVDRVGEVHATIDGHDDQLEIRRGQVSWHDDVFTVHVPGHSKLTVRYDSILDWEEPDGLWH